MRIVSSNDKKSTTANVTDIHEPERVRLVDGNESVWRVDHWNLALADRERLLNEYPEFQALLAYGNGVAADLNKIEDERGIAYARRWFDKHCALKSRSDRDRIANVMQLAWPSNGGRGWILITHRGAILLRDAADHRWSVCRDTIMARSVTAKGHGIIVVDDVPVLPFTYKDENERVDTVTDTILSARKLFPAIDLHDPRPLVTLMAAAHPPRTPDDSDFDDYGPPAA